LLSIRKELFGRAWQLGKLLPAVKDGVGHGKWMIWLPDGNSGRISRLRIAKSSISERLFAFQKKNRFTRGKRDFVVSIASSRPASKNVLISAQFLTQNRLSFLGRATKLATDLICWSATSDMERNCV
jgi:hypothetical protein